MVPERARRPGAVLALVLGAISLSPPASAQVDRQVILVVMPGTSYEAALGDPLLRDLAGHGGIGLMTTAGEGQTPAQAAISLSAGRSADASPPEPIEYEEAGPGLAIDADPYRRVAGEAEVGLLATVLRDAGNPLAYIDLTGSRPDPAMLVAMDARGRIPLAFLNEFPALSKLPPEFLGEATTRVVESVALLVSPDPGVIPFALEQSEASEVLVLVVSAPPTEDMRERGDTVTPVVLASGPPNELSEPAGAEGGVTSETTSRDGLVSNVDVAPTVLEFLGVNVPADLAGSPIFASGEAPTELHERYLEWRDVVTPVGVLALALAIGSLVAGLVLLVGPWRVRRRPAAVLAVLGLSSVALLVAFVPGSLLPSFDLVPVVGALALGAALLLVLALRGDGPLRPVALVSLAGLGLVAVDVAAGWRSGLTPLLGGSALDGERFVGLGNPYAGIVLSGAVLGAALFPVRWGTALIAGAAVFAGLPFLGADLGGAVTLGTAAGLWLGLSRWGDLRWNTLAVAALGAALSLALVVVSHRLFPDGPAHVTRAVEGPGGLIGALEVFFERLSLNLRTTWETPAAWLAVLGLPFWLVVVLSSPAKLRPPLERGSPWQRACIVLALSGIVGYVVNDTFGTASIAFLFLSAAVICPALLARWRGDLREPSKRTAPAAG